MSDDALPKEDNKAPTVQVDDNADVDDLMKQFKQMSGK